VAHQLPGEGGIDPSLHGHSPGRWLPPGPGAAGSAGGCLLRDCLRGLLGHVLSLSYKKA
jgi:hypothetical protein